MNSKRFFTLLIGIMVFIGISALEPHSVAAAQRDTIIHGIADVVPGLFNPLLATKTTDEDINLLMFPGLFKIAPDSTLVPYLAESCDISNDGKTFTFYLNKNAVWHDGKKVTAGDVAFSFSSILAPGYTGTGYGRFKGILGAEEYHAGKTKHVEGIRVIDDYVIEVRFNAPSSPGFTNMAKVGIIPKHIWSSYEPSTWEKQTQLLNHPIGCGPYKMTEYVEGQYIVLEAFDDFFEGKPKTPKLVVKITTPDSILAEFRNGTIDIVSVRDLTRADLDTLTGQLGFKTVSFANNVYRYVGINMRKDVFKSLELRQALSYAIDRPLIIKAILEERGVLINVPYLPSGWAAPNENSLNQYAYNPEKAISLLKKAGYEDRDGDGIAEDEDGNKLQFTYKIPVDSKISEQVAVFLQESWRAIGVDVKILSYDYRTVAQQCVMDHDFDLYTLNCQFSLDPNLLPWWHSSAIHDEPGVGSYNFGAFRSARVDELIDLDIAERDQHKRIAYNHEIAQIINAEAPMVFLYVQNNEMAYHPGLKGYQPSTFNIFYNVKNWFIEE